jgi:hypothetical protein
MLGHWWPRLYLLGYRIHHSICYTCLFPTLLVVITVFPYNESRTSDVFCLGVGLWCLLSWMLAADRLTVINWLFVTESESESESYVTTDGLGVKHPSEAYDQIFFFAVGQLRVCWYGALSLTRGRVCRLQMLLVLAILGSESPWDSRPYFTVSDLRLLSSVIVGSIVHCHL